MSSANESKEIADMSMDDKSHKDLKALPVRAYLDETVVPLLLKGMSALVKERPEDPIEWLATYLLKNKNQK